jgi:peptide/nickel transport system substrate-binding protein
VPFTQTRWPIFAALVAGIAIVAIFWYFVLSNPKGEAVPASGGRYVEGVTQAPERINPLFAPANTVDADLSSLVFSGLVRLSPDGTPQPELAERWDVTGNGQTYTFHLRRGVAWHDGEEFSADDVVFTYEAIADPGFKGDPALAQLLQGVAVRARDDLTVEFRLEQPYAPFLAYLTVGILPQHLFDGLDANQLFNHELNARPVGTGPYRYKTSSDDTIELESNSTYYLGPPLVSSFELRIFQDEAQIVSALRSGEIDGALLSPSTPRTELDVLADDGLALHPLAGSSLNIVYLNPASPLFATQEVREALLRAVDLPSLLAEVAAGQGVPSEAGIPRGSWAYTPAEGLSFDPGRASAALEQAGWQRGGDGVRRRGDLRLAFTLSTANDPHRVAIAEQLANQWRAIGASVVVQPLDAGTYIESHLLPRAFETALVLIDPGPDPDPYPFWHSSQATGEGRNLAGLADPRIDDVLQRARQTTETERRKELYALFQGYFISTTPALPLYAPVSTYVQRARVQGFAEAMLFSHASRFANVREWYVQTRVE